MNVYETIAILDASLPDEAIEASTRKITDIITAEGGEILKADPWGRRRMGYAINKHQRGFYTLLLYSAPPTVVKKLEDFYRVHDPVVKAMNVKLEKKQREAALRSLAEEAQAKEAEGKPSPAEETPAPETPAETAAGETAAGETAAPETPAEPPAAGEEK